MRHGSSAPPRRTRAFARQEEGQGRKKKENCCCCVDLFVVDRVVVLLWPALVGLRRVVLIGYC